jgi:hypothetical protein
MICLHKQLVMYSPQFPNKAGYVSWHSIIIHYLSHLVPIYAIKSMFKAYKHQMNGLPVTPCSVLWLHREYSSDPTHDLFPGRLFSSKSFRYKNTPWPESATELYRTKLMPTFADRECYVVSVTDPHARIRAFLDRSRYFFFQVAPQLYSWVWVDPVPDPLLLTQCGNTRNRT